MTAAHTSLAVSLLLVEVGTPAGVVVVTEWAVGFQMQVLVLVVPIGISLVTGEVLAF